MTIEKGRPWGEPWGGDRSGHESEATVISTGGDADLARHVIEWRTKGRSGEVVFRPSTGDLLRTLGLGEPRPDATALRFPMDLGWVTLDENPETPFVAHVFLAGRWGAGPGAVAMNAAWLGPWYLGPKAHPNDGLVDVTSGRLSIRDRREARKRALTGTHLPHPDLTTRRVEAWSAEFDRARRARVDGVDRGRCRRVAVRIEPDAFWVVA